MINAAKHWSEVALDAHKRDYDEPTVSRPENPGPCYAARALAMIHAAFHDGYCSGLGSGNTYRFDEPARIQPSENLAQLAGGRAAYQMLRHLYGRQNDAIMAQYTAFLNLLQNKPTPPSKEEIREASRIGDKVAGDMQVARNRDHAEEADPLGDVPSPRVVGAYSYDPVSMNKQLYAEFWAKTDPFLAVPYDFIDLRPNPPPRLDSNMYRSAFDEVREEGHVSRRNLANKKAQIGYFWAYDGARKIGTPPRLYNQIIHAVAEKDGLDELQWSELLCRCNLIMADAGISAWDSKYFYYLWRPITGITLDPISPDMSWEPVGSPASNAPSMHNFTPNFPAYTSGHATFGTACFETLRLFREKVFQGQDADKIAINFTSDELNGITYDTDPASPRPSVPMNYTSIDEMIKDNLESRIWLGVHWRYDGDEGAIAGKELATRLYHRL